MTWSSPSFDSVVVEKVTVDCSIDAARCSSNFVVSIRSVLEVIVGGGCIKGGPVSRKSVDACS